MKRLLILFLLSVSALRAQVAVAPLQLARQQFLSATGIPLAGGCLNFFATGTSTPQAIYADSGGVFQLANPLQLDAAGEASVWMSNTGYDIVANTGVANTLCSVSLGTQLWKQTNVNPFSIINSGSNYIVAAGTVDPSGSQGELAYRTDIPCFRGFTTFWDCFARLTDTQTLTNKTLNSPAFTGTATGLVANAATLNSPSILGTTLSGVTVASNNGTNFTSYTNDTVTGTSLNTLTKLKILGAGTTAIITTAGDQGGVEGVTVGGNGTSGSAVIQKSGQVICAFDGATTAVDYVQISSSVNGDCHDTGSSSYPAAGGQIIGRVLTTIGGAGNALIDLFGPEIKTAAVVPVAAVNTTGLSANVASTPILTPGANGFYRFTCYAVVTQAATTSSSLPSCVIIYTDADSSIAETLGVTPINSTNTLGSISWSAGTGPSMIGFFAKTGISISYSTSGYASVGATPMLYALHLRLEGPF